jgi:hypothetical protein
MLDDEQDYQTKEAGGKVVQHNAPTAGQSFQLADGPWFGDVEEAEEREGDQSMRPVRPANG